MRAFLGLSTGGSVTVAEPGHTYTLPSPPCAQPSFSGRSGDGRRLSYQCLDPQGVMVVDSADGHLVGTVPARRDVRLSSMTTGTTVFGASWHRQGVRNTGVPALRRGNRRAAGRTAGHATGLQRLAVDLQPGDRSPVRRKPRRHRRAGCQHPAGGGPDSFPSSFAAVRVDGPRPGSARSVRRLVWNRSTTANLVRVSLVHTGTFATIGSYDIPIDGRVRGNGARAASASGVGPGRRWSPNRVATLTWAIDASRSMATEQVVEVGFTPGETVARLAVAAGATSLTVPGVPPGRYYVRIRSVNGTGVAHRRTR